MVFRSGFQNYKPDLGQDPPLRRYVCTTPGECSYCDQFCKPGEPAPPHDASARCESGRRNHCSCDVCF